MKSLSLDALYAQLHKHIVLAQSYAEITELPFIIKSCRLKPYDFLFGIKSNKVVLHRQWVDEFGNSLHIEKDKSLTLTYGDLSLDRSKLISTDLYYGLSLDRIAKMSKLIYVCSGTEEENQQETIFLTFVGLDHYLRSYLYSCGEWQQVSSLFLGIEHLKLLSHYTDLPYFRPIIKEKTPMPCLAAGQWLSCLPLDSELVSLLNKRSSKVLDVLQ
jgi:hypothetical protein